MTQVKKEKFLIGLIFCSLFIGRAFWLVETFKARAQLESALRDRKIAISLKRLIDGDPKQERVKKTALIGQKTDQSEPSFFKSWKIEKYVGDGLSRVNNTFHRNEILEKLLSKFSSKTRKINFWQKILKSAFLMDHEKIYWSDTSRTENQFTVSAI